MYTVEAHPALADQKAPAWIPDGALPRKCTLTQLPLKRMLAIDGSMPLRGPNLHATASLLPDLPP